MSETATAEKLTIVGTCSEISEKNGWTAFHITVPGKQYPVKLSTKVATLIEQGRAVGDALATWTYKEQQGGENPNKPGTFYTNRYFEGVELGAQQTNGPTASGSSTPTQTGHYEGLAAGDRERSIVRQTAIKAACWLFMGKGAGTAAAPDEDPTLAGDNVYGVVAAAQRFENWILRDLVDDEEIPF